MQDKTVENWLTEIRAAIKREEDWRKDALSALRVYNGEETVTTPFNILYSNTETLLPSLYSSQPRPRVDRRFKDENPLGKAAAEVGQRTLEFEVDTNNDEYETFDSVMTDAVVDTLVPGRACTRVCYDAKILSVPDGTKVKQDEFICYESVKFNRYAFGFARKWKQVPWFAFMHDVTQEEAERLFGEALAAELTYTEEDEGGSDDGEKDSKDEGDKTKEKVKTSRIWEIWDKTGGRKVRFIAECYTEKELKVDDDPLGLTGFFPLPEPLRLTKKSNNLVPTTLYTYYRNQAVELNNLTRRIKNVVAAIKVRGVYDSTLSEFQNLLDSDDEDNKLVPATDVAQLQDRKLEDSIWLLPLDKLVTTLSQLLIARQQCKTTIYEITGLSDIIRGATQASETARAQEIKTQWGTLRLKRLQREVQNYARDLLRISLEIAAKKFSPRTFIRMTGLQYPTMQQKEIAKTIMAQSAAVQQPPPPEVAMAMQKPSWEEILGALRDDTQRQYKIDIETNSTIDLEATEDKKDLAEIMNAMSQFLNGVAPLVETGAMSIEAAKAMLLTIVRRYRFGADVEDQIKAMQAPKKQDDGKAQLAQIELQRAQAQFQQEQETARMDMELKREEHQMRKSEMAARAQVAAFLSKQKIIEAERKAKAAERQAMIEAQAQIAVNASAPAKEPQNAPV